MARYTGPTTKKARSFGDPIFGFDKAFERRKYPPGQHGLSKKKKQASNYSLQLTEKQKAKYTYGILEKQFANIFDRAARAHGVTGEVLIQLIEARLDNVVFRLGIAPTRSAARQLVSHRHITVNGHVVNVPSYTLKPGDIIAIREKSRSLEVINNSIATHPKEYPWLEWNRDTMTGRFVMVPERSQVPENIKEQLIVELYSR